MADITFSWSRLTWPELALRHAAPWPRKISATSSTGRGIAAGDYAGGWTSLLLFSAFPDRLRFGCDSRSSGLLTAEIMPLATWALRTVVSILVCPNNAWMVLIWVFSSSRWVAKLWRNVCSVTPFLIPAASAASWNERLRWRVVIGLPADFLLGNSQRSGRGIPAS